jgi:hypothetical protein
VAQVFRINLDMTPLAVSAPLGRPFAELLSSAGLPLCRLSVVTRTKQDDVGLPGAWKAVPDDLRVAGLRAERLSIYDSRCNPNLIHRPSRAGLDVLSERCFLT